MSTGGLLVSSRGSIGQRPPYAELGVGDRALSRKIVGNAGVKTSSVTLQSSFLGPPDQRGRLRSRDVERFPEAAAAADIRGCRRGGGCKIRAGLPVVSGVPVLGPLANAILNPVALFIIYAAGASRFWGGFRRTTYSDASATKVTLTALWPALFLVSATFRSNFKRAIQ